jgi:hypothetical protein
MGHVQRAGWPLVALALTVTYSHHLDDLRAALALDGLVVGQHRNRIEQVGQRIPHAIVWEGDAAASTCVPYALGLEQEPGYAGVAGAHADVFAGRDFVEWLLRSHLDGLARPEPDALALYFADGRWAHVGLHRPDARVVSRWGLFPVYEHDVFEVPFAYGDTVCTYVRPSRRVALLYFLEYARERGVSDAELRRLTGWR